MENEQLKKEVGYHMQQTEVLLLQNEKLIKEIGEVTRSLQLNKEVIWFTFCNIKHLQLFAFNFILYLH